MLRLTLLIALLTSVFAVSAQTREEIYVTNMHAVRNSNTSVTLAFNKPSVPSESYALVSYIVIAQAYGTDAQQPYGYLQTLVAIGYDSRYNVEFTNLIPTATYRFWVVTYTSYLGRVYGASNAGMAVVSAPSKPTVSTKVYECLHYNRESNILQLNPANTYVTLRFYSQCQNEGIEAFAEEIWTEKVRGGGFEPGRGSLLPLGVYRTNVGENVARWDITGLQYGRYRLHLRVPNSFGLTAYDFCVGRCY